MADKFREAVRGDFVEEGPHQWALNRHGYRFVVRQTDGAIELVFKAKITSDPSPEDWTKALRTVNAFLTTKRIANGRTESQK